MDYKRIVLGDFPEAVKLYEAGLIHPLSEEIYCIRREYAIIRPNHKYKYHAIVELSERFNKSVESVAKYLKGQTI